MKERAENLLGVTRRVRTGCGWLYVTLNFAENAPFEVFLRLGKAGCCRSTYLESIGRLLSICLRNGMDIEEHLVQMTGIECEKKIIDEHGGVLSCSDGVAKSLRLIMKKRETTDSTD